MAKVVEIGLVDSLSVLKDNGEELKVYFSSLKPPRSVLNFLIDRLFYLKLGEKARRPVVLVKSGLFMTFHLCMKHVNFFAKD